MIDIFQSTLPLRGATDKRLHDFYLAMISIHAPLTGSDQCFWRFISSRQISIHAPLTGSDGGELESRFTCQDFNPRSPYGERQERMPSTSFSKAFQSTLPLRGATLSANSANTITNNFNPRSPYGERLHQLTQKSPPTKFQSTLPLRGATSV